MATTWQQFFKDFGEASQRAYGREIERRDLKKERRKDRKTRAEEREEDAKRRRKERQEDAAIRAKERAEDFQRDQIRLDRQEESAVAAQELAEKIKRQNQREDNQALIDSFSPKVKTQIESEFQQPSVIRPDAPKLPAPQDEMGYDVFQGTGIADELAESLKQEKASLTDSQIKAAAIRGQRLEGIEALMRQQGMERENKIFSQEIVAAAEAFKSQGKVDAVNDSGEFVPDLDSALPERLQKVFYDQGKNSGTLSASETFTRTAAESNKEAARLAGYGAVPNPNPKNYSDITSLVDSVAAANLRKKVDELQIEISPDLPEDYEIFSKEELLNMGPNELKKKMAGLSVIKRDADQARAVSQERDMAEARREPIPQAAERAKKIAEATAAVEETAASREVQGKPIPVPKAVTGMLGEDVGYYLDFSAWETKAKRRLTPDEIQEAYNHYYGDMGIQPPKGVWTDTRSEEATEEGPEPAEKSKEVTEPAGEVRNISDFPESQRSVLMTYPENVPFKAANGDFYVREGQTIRRVNPADRK